MKFYHVSQYVSEKQVLNHRSRNCRCFCEYISNCYAENYDEYKTYYDELSCYNLKNITGKDVSKWICEAIFDGVRRKQFPDMPSRVWGVYLTSSLEDAYKFREEWRNVYTHHIFEIDVAEKEVYGFDMTFFSEAYEKIFGTGFSIDSYKQAKQLACLYWSRKIKIAINEYIIDGTIVVGKCIG